MAILLLTVFFYHTPKRNYKIGALGLKIIQLYFGILKNTFL
jgi:hypothetical protein